MNSLLCFRGDQSYNGHMFDPNNIHTITNAKWDNEYEQLELGKF